MSVSVMLNKFLAISMVLGLTVLFSGCSANLNRVNQKFQSAEECCEQLSEIKYQSLKSSQSFTLGGSQGVRTFDDQKSYFRAFEITNKTYNQLAVHSFLSGIWLSKSHIVKPKVWFLDEQYQVINKPTADYQWDSDFWLGGFLKGEYLIPEKASYVILFADNQPESPSIAYTNYSSNIMPIYTGNGTIYVPTGGSSHTFDIPFSPSGKIKVYAK